MPVQQVDILVIGAGVAACAALLTLHDAPYSVLVGAPAREQGDRIGESLSPSANPILRALGIWDAFLAEAYLPSHANFSAWGTANLVERRVAHGHGWSLDRLRFEQFLWEQCAQFPFP